MQHRRIWTAGAILLAVGSIAATNPDDPMVVDGRLTDAPWTAASYDLPVAIDVPTTLSECGTCAQTCGAPAMHEFSASERGSHEAQGENSHSCSVGWCSQTHGGNDCLAEEEQEEDFALIDDETSRELWMVMASNDPSALADFVAELGSAVIYEPTRRAVQVLSCDGLPYVSIPVTDAQAAALSP